MTVPHHVQTLGRLTIPRHIHTKAIPRSVYRTAVRHCIQTTVPRYIHTTCRRWAIPLLHQEGYIDGRWTGTGQHGTFDVYNPSTGAHIGTVPDMGAEDTKTAIAAAKKAFEEWKHTTAKERHGILKKWNALLTQNREDFSRLITIECGKALAEARSEFDYSNGFIEWFAEEGRRVYGDVVPSPVADRRMLVLRQPVGVSALITPWNFPLAMFTRKAGAALAAGCTVVSKPAEDTPYSVIAAAKLGEEAGIPPGVLNVVTSSKPHAPQIGQAMCESPDVGVISFTGSSNVGKILIKQSADTVKRVAMELGGNAPFIVFESANLHKAAAGFVASKFRGCGQTCVSCNRLIVHQNVREKFISALRDAMAPLKVGDGLTDGVTQGPLINTQAVEKVDSIVQDALSKGARAIVGGKPHEKGGNFYELTVLDNTSLDMACMQDEIFGPVAGIITFKTEKEALDIANMTDMGLAGYFYSQDPSQIWRVSEQLEMGIVGVNTGVASCVEGPFGGWKQSGLGTESGKYGIDEYLERKYVALGGIEPGE